MRKSRKIFLSIFVPLLTILGFCLLIAPFKPYAKAVADIDYGGGIYVHNGATFDFSSGSIYGHKASRGGGVYVENYATFNMNGGTISDNEGDGAIFVDGMGNLNISGGEISGNNGSAIYNCGTANITGGVFSDNTYFDGFEDSPFDIYNLGILTLNGGTFNGRIYNSGGEIHFIKATFNQGSYIYLDDSGNGGLFIESNLTQDIPIELSLASVGKAVAQVTNDITPSESILNHIKVRNMPKNTKLAFDGNKIVIAPVTWTVTIDISINGIISNFAPNVKEINSGYFGVGQIISYAQIPTGPASQPYTILKTLTIAHGTTFKTQASIKLYKITISFSDGRSSVVSWVDGKTRKWTYRSTSPSSGTITEDTTITVSFNETGLVVGPFADEKPVEDKNTRLETVFYEKRRAQQYFKIIETSSK